MNNYLRLISGWIFSFLVLILLLPAIIAILIIVAFVTRQYPVIRQPRSLIPGTGNVNIYKIRTIKGENGFSRLEEKSVNVFTKSEYEQYVPGFCRWLRKTGLDEILQLVNVLKGEMSLIGPRPLAEADLLLIKSSEPGIIKRRAELKSKPGITGCAQLWMDRKKGAANMLELDLYYEKNKSLSLDLKIILETIYIIISSRHSDAIISLPERPKRWFKINTQSNFD